MHAGGDLGTRIASEKGGGRPVARWWMKAGLTWRSYYRDGCGTSSPALLVRDRRGTVGNEYLTADTRVARPTRSGGSCPSPLPRRRARCSEFYSRLKLKSAERLHV